MAVAAIRDFEPSLASLTLRPYDDGRFVVRVNGDTIYDKHSTGRFPRYMADLRDALARYRDMDGQNR